MISKEKARLLRTLIERASLSLDDNDALDGVELYPLWNVGQEYDVGQRIQFEQKLYRVVQKHTSQSGWEPSKTPALFVEVARPGEIPVWHQPTGAHDTYNIGDKVLYPDINGNVWQSVVDNNSWQPGVYGWEQIK